MNMKKVSISILALAIAASSAFAWSKKAENMGNLGRMYMSVEGGVNTQKGKLVSTGETNSPTGAQAAFVINAPVFKPGVNAFKNIKWAGVDVSAFFDYSYTNDFKFNNDADSLSFTQYSVGAAVTPYLNFETTLPVFKAIKPFGTAYAGYSWSDFSGEGTYASEHSNYFVYGVGAGVEVVIIDNLSFTPMWKWHGNAESGVPTYQTVGADLSYWFTDQFCFSVYWTHSFGYKTDANFELMHGDIIGAKFKIGFMR